MRPQRLDTTLGFKAIALSEELSGSEKRVAAAILDSFNHKTTQCDPSLGGIAQSLGIARRTVIRAVKRIETFDLFKKVRHGGNFHRNSYTPNWRFFRQLDRQWSARKKMRRQQIEAAIVSQSTSNVGQHSGDEPVTQTLPINSSHVTSSASAVVLPSCPVTPGGQSGRTSEKGNLTAEIPNGRSASRLAQRHAAERRWNTALINRFAGSPALYARILDALTPELQEKATQAEMQREGAGLALILEGIAVR